MNHKGANGRWGYCNPVAPWEDRRTARERLLSDDRYVNVTQRGSGGDNSSLTYGYWAMCL